MRIGKIAIMVLMLLIAMAATTPAFETRLLSDRTKAVASAPAGYPATWKEEVKAVVAKDPADTDFNRMMVRRARQLAHDYYGDEDAVNASFQTQDQAGWVVVDEVVDAASPDILSANAEADYYDAGMAHPHNDAHDFFIWSRRLHRVLTQQDVFARTPDAALRHKAFAAFDNKEAVTVDAAKDGIPVDWNSASIGPDGITWTYGPYELGGYVSAGTATIRWADLKPYLRRDLPFAIAAIRKVAPMRK